MKRSQINAAIANAHEALRKHGIGLPEYAYWSADDWRRKAGPEHRRIFENMLGWACTDFGQGDFDRCGITMFDVRNGTPEPNLGTPYGEKIFVLKPGQRLPFHFHYNKTEDIISYAGGTLMIELYNARDDETMDETSAGIVHCDGVEKRFTAGQVFEIPHGASLTIVPKLYHRFWAKAGGDVLVGGEISTISVPKTDNKFVAGGRRFVPIEEDEAPRYLLNVDYDKLREAA
ncbi:MAG TPA: D-lyxose/D-mannose family sugar isomerase [Casimicrobiaceae bacterium]|nr:D-lyxose/D-mannose family sugar isomerase [Casimicrobiaceae bacterium]